MVFNHFDANQLSAAAARPNGNGIKDPDLEAAKRAGKIDICFSDDFITSATNSFNKSGTWSLLESLMLSIARYESVWYVRILMTPLRILAAFLIIHSVLSH